MPQRIMNLWTVLLGVAGLLLVAMLIVLGVDLVRASRSGPRWKRMLITASLAVLAAIGVYVAAGELSEQPQPGPVWSCYAPQMTPKRISDAFAGRMAAVKKLGVMDKIKSDVLKKLTVQMRIEMDAYEKFVSPELPTGSDELTRARQTVSDARAWLAAADMRLAVDNKSSRGAK